MATVITVGNDVKVELPKNVLDELNQIFAYQKRDEIQMYGAARVKKTFNAWLLEYVQKKAESDVKALENRFEMKQHQAFAKLVKMGVKVDEARKIAYGETDEQPTSINHVAAK